MASDIVLDSFDYGSLSVKRNLILKRGFDITASLAILLLALPVMLVIALFLKFSEGNKVIFKQKRGGLKGRAFDIYKFRTMKTADSGTEEIEQAKKADPRITKMGAFLRKTSLDELPQLLNVLKGDMSIVGPRPHVVSQDNYYAAAIKNYSTRNMVKPGITGWAQVKGCRGETDTLGKMEDRVFYDLDYIKNGSLFLDIKIMIMTPFVLFHKNAY